MGQTFRPSSQIKTSTPLAQTATGSWEMGAKSSGGTSRQKLHSILEARIRLTTSNALRTTVLLGHPAHCTRLDQTTMASLAWWARKSTNYQSWLIIFRFEKSGSVSFFRAGPAHALSMTVGRAASSQGIVGDCAPNFQRRACSTNRPLFSRDQCSICAHINKNHCQSHRYTFFT